MVAAGRFAFAAIAVIGYVPPCGDVRNQAAAEPAKADEPQRLKDALRQARIDAAERTGMVVELHDAEVARLEMLNEALDPVFAEIPAEVDMFDRGISRGEKPRLWIDAIAHVAMGRDKRIYRFLQDTRYGRKVLAENVSISKTNRTSIRAGNYVLRSARGGSTSAARSARWPCSLRAAGGSSGGGAPPIVSVPPPARAGRPRLLRRRRRRPRQARPPPRPSSLASFDTAEFRRSDGPGFHNATAAWAQGRDRRRGEDRASSTPASIPTAPNSPAGSTRPAATLPATARSRRSTITAPTWR